MTYGTAIADLKLTEQAADATAPGAEIAPAGALVLPFCEPAASGSCAHCGDSLPPAVDHCPRCGCWTVANRGAIKTGLHSDRAAAAQLPGQEELRAALTDKRTAIVADLGRDLSTVAAGEVERYLRLTVLLDTLWADLSARGILTTKGRRRAALTAFLQVNDRLDRVVGRLGLVRRQRLVTETFEAAIAAQPEAR